MVDFPKTPTTAIEKELTISHGFPRDEFSTETIFIPFERKIQVKDESIIKSTLPILSLSALIPILALLYISMRKK
jgi:hypothetical protein